MSISANYPALRPALLLDFANSQQLDPRVTFSRSTTAPYYDGKTSALAEQNLLLYSQGNFTQAYWNKQNVTVTDNTVIAPDGTTTASTLTTSVGLANHNIVVTGTYAGTIAGTYTESWFIKPNTSNFVTVFVAYISGQWVCATANLSTVAITQTGSSGASTYVSSSITASTNGYYRITLTYNISSASGMLSGVQINSSATPTYGSFGLESWTALGTESVYIWGAQLEQRSSVTAYNATTTSAITNYIPQLLTAPINAPRFDFNPTTGESLGLLIEQSSTNLLTYSQDFSNAAWSKARTSIATGADIAPDGTQTMQLLVEDTSTNSHIIYNASAITVTSGTSYTFTIYAKQYGRTWLNIVPSFSTGIAYFDLANVALGTVSNGTASITSVGNGVVKCSFTVTTNTTSGFIFIQLASANGTNNYTGNGYSGIYIWQAQLEALPFATSPIPTTSAQVTRASDNASMTGTNFSSWWNNGQDTIYASFKKNNLGSNGSLFQVYSSSNNRVAINTITDGTMSYDIYINAVLNNSLSGYIANSIGKSVAVIQSNNYFQSFNGNSSSTIASTMVTATTLSIGNRGATSDLWLNGWISKLAVYPQALTSAQSNALTGS